MQTSLSLLMATGTIENILRKYRQTFFPVISFNPSSEKLLKMDFTKNNINLAEGILKNTNLFSLYINQLLEKNNCKYGIGGYLEHRDIYSVSKVFDAATQNDEPRRIHLGIDIWAPAGTPVYAFMGGMVHSFAFNNNYGDYGATLILLHQLDSISFYTLYGHISLADIENIEAGNYMVRGQQIASLGQPNENGGWPPHLHVQVIAEMGMNRGDYPGVCAVSEKEKYATNCPNPDLILQMMQYANE